MNKFVLIMISFCCFSSFGKKLNLIPEKTNVYLEYRNSQRFRVIIPIEISHAEIQVEEGEIESLFMVLSLDQERIPKKLKKGYMKKEIIFDSEEIVNKGTFLQGILKKTASENFKLSVVNFSYNEAINKLTLFLPVIRVGSILAQERKEVSAESFHIIGEMGFDLKTETSANIKSLGDSNHLILNKIMSFSNKRFRNFSLVLLGLFSLLGVIFFSYIIKSKFSTQYFFNGSVSGKFIGDSLAIFFILLYSVMTYVTFKNI